MCPFLNLSSSAVSDTVSTQGFLENKLKKKKDDFFLYKSKLVNINYTDSSGYN